MKKIFLMLSLLLVVCMVSGCAYLPLLYAAGSAAPTETTDTITPQIIGDSGDTVTISKEEYEKYQKFADLFAAYDTANAYFYKDTNTDLMVEYSVQGMLAALGDPYTYYYNAQDYAAMWEDDEGNYAGIGIQISTSYETGLCTISRIFTGSPAGEAGLRRGDILRKTEDIEVSAATINDAVNVMRGTPGTPVNVVVERGGEELSFTVNRASITVNRVDQIMLTDEIGYIALYEFAGDCAVKFDAALQDLLSKGAKGLIIDLRDNHGGWVNDAQTIGDEFLDAGTLCYMEYRDGSREYTYTKDGKIDIPLVILVNGYSASSSEILTGALKDRADATVVGTQTYGKGIVQFVLPVGTNGAGMQVTAAQYFTPNGNAVHEIGITPDVVIDLPEGDDGMYELGDTEKDVQLNKALEIMKEKMDSTQEDNAA